MTALITGVNAEDVYNITGTSVDEATVTQAMSLIELYVGINLSNFAGFNARNRTWLQKAVAYQAAWMLTQVDLFSRSDFQSISQDGLSINPRDNRSMMLAPLAQKALSRVSWISPNRTVNVSPSPQQRLAERVNNFDSATWVSPGVLPVGAPYIEYDEDDEGWV